ncbi:zinc transporter ZIP1-like [Bacillus rossius redtenbacheri]|uniref:zinc transporter ZIP1-like n=1 Tax=Bacillus rossius redtenbacheri TaxID=93214 RepID=UPI002FDD7157
MSSSNGTADGELVTAKVVAMVTLGSTSLVVGATPILLARCCGWAGVDGTMAMSGRARSALNLLLSFGGGALLSTTFLHLMHEVSEAVENLQAMGDLPSTPFPLPQFIMCCGFFTIYLVEELVHLYVHKQHDHPSPTACAEVDMVKEHMEHSESSKHTSHSHLVVHGDPSQKLVNSVRGFLIVLALSIHELFEGLAVGLERTAGDTWYMLGAVAAHKLVIAFCVSAELVSTRVDTWLALLYSATFSLVTPIGVGAGLALTRGGAGSADGGAPNAVLQGLATGTLLYVVFFEILQRQRRLGGAEGRFSGLRQLLAVAAGFAVMMLLLSTVGHEREHSH